MEFLHLLEGIRTPFFDRFFQYVTFLGEETLFMVVALVFFWCVDKKKGYFLLYVGLFGTVINQCLKIICRIPRPWVQDPNLTIVESARQGAGGYSFPSGHTQTAVGVYGGVACCVPKCWQRILCIALALLVAFSRMYLGVHTPADVLVSIGVGVVLIVLCSFLFQKAEEQPRLYLWLFAVLIAASLGFVFYANLISIPADATDGDLSNFASAVKNSWQMLGTSIGLLLVYLFDTTCLRFETKAPLGLQAVKVAGGFALVLLVKLLLKEPLLVLTGGHPFAHGIRYLIMTVAGGGLWPISFRWMKGRTPNPEKE